MVSKTGNQFPNALNLPSDREFAHAIGAALRHDLGASRRATKTVMVWADVSDRTARGWLQGLHSPGGVHLIALSAHSHRVMELFLMMAGREGLNVSLNITAVEEGLERALAQIRALKKSV